MTDAPAIDISRLMRPRSIAIVGISPEPSSAGFLVLRNLEDFGYSGAVHLVSRNQTNIGSRACVRAIDDLPEGIDAAMLFIPRAAIEDAVAACARRGVGGVVIFAAGFAEAGGQWQAASLALYRSAIAAAIEHALARGVFVSVYFDDLIGSSTDEQELRVTYDGILAACVQANLVANPNKLIEPVDAIIAFNCLLTHGKAEVTEDRIQKFIAENRGPVAQDSFLAYWLRVERQNHVSAS